MALMNMKDQEAALLDAYLNVDRLRKGRQNEWDSNHCIDVQQRVGVPAWSTVEGGLASTRSALVIALAAIA